ncbi:hypothetical protein [Chromobacterium subtsugae]|uniref:hypothetical protein n=1 Tax=Chromobacterium subtsugae TaxID=251747 RepID=UPI000B14AA88|nr:hypothetical protein [Chromobacterium subtsugae]
MGTYIPFPLGTIIYGSSKHLDWSLEKTPDGDNEPFVLVSKEDHDEIFWGTQWEPAGNCGDLHVPQPMDKISFRVNAM